MGDTQWQFTREPGVLKNTNKKRKIKWVQYQPSEAPDILADDVNTISNEVLDKRLCDKSNDDSEVLDNPTMARLSPASPEIPQSLSYSTQEIPFSIPHHSKSALISSTVGSLSSDRFNYRQ